MLLAVPDVNVLVSALITPAGPPGRIYVAWKRGRFSVITSSVIIAKALEVIHRPHIKDTFLLNAQAINDLETLLREHAILTPHALDLKVVEQDPEDDAIIIAAVEGKADCIISGDAHLKNLGSYEGIPILSPAEFIAKYNLSP